MKKIINILLLLLITFTLSSFNTNNGTLYNKVSLDDDSLVFSNGTNDMAIKINKNNNYKLVGDTTTYRIVVEDSWYLAYFTYFDHYSICGYSADQSILINAVLDDTTYNYLTSNTTTIYKDNNKFFNYTKIYNNYLTYQAKTINQISPLSFNYGTASKLKDMTSTDEYLDGYTPEFYDKQIKQTDDDIVKIVPKEWFFETGDHYYAGKEYIIIVKTTPYVDYNYSTYSSWVFILDIDFSYPNSTQERYLSNKGAVFSEPASSQALIIKPVVNHYYVGIDHKIDYSPTVIETFQKKTVLYRGNFFNSGDEMPVYANLKNLTYSIDDFIENASDTYLEYIQYVLQIDGKSFNNDSPTKYQISATEDILINSLKQLLPGQINDLLDAAEYIYDFIQNYDNNEDNDKISIKESSELKEISLDNTGSERVKIASVNFKSFLNILNNQNSINYKYLFNLKETYYPKNISNHTRKIMLDFELYDYSGAKININSNNHIYFNRVDQNVLYAGPNKIQPGLIFNFDNYKYECVNSYTPSKTDMYAFELPDHYNYYIRITVPTDGHIIATSESQIPSKTTKTIIAKMEKGHTYYVTVGAKTTNYTTQEITIKNIQSLTFYEGESTLPNLKGTFTHVYKILNPYEQGIYTLTTMSYTDTELFVYSDTGRLIAYDNNSLYNDDDAEPDKNACVYTQIGGHRYFYVVILVKSKVENAPIEFNLIRW